MHHDTSIRLAREEMAEALKKLERDLETPLVAGEAGPWTAHVQRAIADFAQLMRKHLADAHREQFEEMIANDPPKARQVAQLQETDQKLEEQFAKLKAHIDSVVRRADQAGGDEAPIRKEIEHLSAAGLAFVVEFRKQEVQIQTWFLESLNRDRGDAD